MSVSLFTCPCLACLNMSHSMSLTSYNSVNLSHSESVTDPTAIPMSLKKAIRLSLHASSSNPRSSHACLNLFR